MANEPESKDLTPPDEGSNGGGAALEVRPEDAQVAEMLGHTIDVPVLASVVDLQRAPDAADTLETLEDDEAVELLEQMEDEKAAEALAHMARPLAVGVLEDLAAKNAEYASRLLSLMAPDDAADLLQPLDDEETARLLDVMDDEPAEDLSRLITYDEESAGGMMTTDFLAVAVDATVRQAIEYIRANPIDPDLRDALVVDTQNHLVGLLDLRRLLLAHDEERIETLMYTNVTVVPPDLDREEVARTFDRYDHAMLPVIDEERRLLGIVTVDDVIDIIRAEHTEDVQKTVGAGAGEAVYSSLLEKIKGRSVWLIISLMITMPAAFIVLQFETLIEDLAFLAVLMPVVAAVAGNAGHQALAVTLRGIVLDEVRPDRVLPLILREGSVGALNGLIVGAALTGVVTGISFVVETANWKLGLIAGGSMTVSMFIGTLTGSAVPLLMKRFGADPAAASAIFLIMITDAISFSSLLGLAFLAQAWLS